MSKCQYLLSLKDGKITVKLKIKKKADTGDEMKKIMDEMPDNNLTNGFRKDCGKGDHLKHSELLHFITS